MQIELLIEGDAALADAVDKSQIDIAAIIGHEERFAGAQFSTVPRHKFM
jgi:hypothetical protein